MKPSYYNIFIDNYPDNDHTLVYNTRTQAMGVFENTFARMLKLKMGSAIEFDSENELIENGFCIENEQNEQQILKDWFHEICYNKKSITATILTTYSCNFACSYCFEKNIKKTTVNMSTHTSDEVYRWLIYKALDINATDINIFFYGGEPLMNKEIIINIAGSVKEFCYFNKINFKFGIVTNGYLINKKDTAIYKSLGLDFYRITLDGSESWHNKTRYLKDTKHPTFNRIIKNINQNIDGVKTLISGNITDSNYEGILDLIKYLGSHEIKTKIHSMTFSPIMNIPEKYGTIETSKCMNETDEINIQRSFEIDNMLEQYGFKNSRNKIGMQTCPFKINETDIAISTDGSIYKCPVTLGQSEFCVGHVSIKNLNSKNDKIVSNEAWTKCFPCSYLPICQAGCYYQAFVKHGNLFAIDCPKNYLEPYLKQKIKEEYEKN